LGEGNGGITKITHATQKIAVASLILGTPKPSSALDFDRQLVELTHA
jgi:hypothetical protein